MCTFVTLAFAVVAGLIAVAAAWPLESTPQRSLPTLSAKAFQGVELKTTNYNGSALLAFTLNTTTDDSCVPCNDFAKLTNTAEFQKQHSRWWSADELRIGKIYCNQQQDLCTRFGVGGDTEEAPGYPYITWFKGGKEVEAYSGDRTLEGFVSWVKAKQADGVL